MTRRWPACFVYGLHDPDTGLLRYVGKTKRGWARPRSHLCPSGWNRYQTRLTRWLAKLHRFGLKPTVRLLEICTSEEDAFAQERRWIADSRAAGVRLLNLTDGGDGPHGFRMPKTQREKISRAHQGKTGKPLSAEHRAKLSAVHAGKPKSRKHRAKLAAVLCKARASRSQDFRTKIAATLSGRQLSVAHRAAISLGQTGRKFSPTHRANMVAAWKIRKLKQGSAAS